MKIARFELSLFGINTYVVWDPATKDCAIVDPGMVNDREREALTGFISRNGLKPVHLINTHLHIDHAIGNAFVSETYGLPTEAHRADAPLGAQLAGQARMFGLLEQVNDVEVDRQLEPGDVIRIGDGELRVIHVPGHTPGGLALYDAKDGWVISGDSLFQRSIGRTDLPGGDHRTLLESVRNGLLTLPAETVVYPGHGPSTTIGEEREENPFL